MLSIDEGEVLVAPQPSTAHHLRRRRIRIFTRTLIVVLRTTMLLTSYLGGAIAHQQRFIKMRSMVTQIYCIRRAVRCQ